jgi:hypothetical protein
VEAKWVDTSKKNPCQGFRVQMLTVEGNSARCSMGKALNLALVGGGNLTPGAVAGSTCDLGVKVTPVQTGIVELDLECAQTLPPAPALPGKLAVAGRNCIRLNIMVELGKTQKIPLNSQGKEGKPTKWMEVTVKDFSHESKPVGFMELNPNLSPMFIARFPDGMAAVPPPAPIPMAPPVYTPFPAVPPMSGLLPPPVPAPPMDAVKDPEGPGYYAPVSRPLAVPPPAPPVAMAVMPPAAPEGYYSCPVPAEPMAPRGVIRAVRENGKDRLELHHSNSARITVDSFDLNMPGCDSLKVSADHHQVALSCEKLEVVADHVTADHEGRLVLQGHVQVTFHPKDQAVQKVAVEKAILRVTDWHLTLEMSAGMSAK